MRLSIKMIEALLRIQADPLALIHAKTAEALKTRRLVSETYRNAEAGFAQFPRYSLALTEAGEEFLQSRNNR